MARPRFPNPGGGRPLAGLAAIATMTLMAGPAFVSLRSLSCRGGARVVQRAVTAESESTVAVATDPAAGVEEEEEDVSSLKAELLRLGLLTGRGSQARRLERTQGESLVASLESLHGSKPPAAASGLWELAFSDVEPFRASIFFLSLATAVEQKIKRGASEGSLPVHRLATSISEVGRVAYDFENGTLRSLVELKVGVVPSLPLALTGTVISTGEFATFADDSTFSLTLQNTTVQESTVKYGLPLDGGLQRLENRDLLSFIADQVAPSGEIFASVLGETPQVLLSVSFCDEDLLVLRTPEIGDHYFVFTKGDRDSWPALEELKLRAPNTETSLVGSAFALGMLNPFISRGSR